MHSYAIQERAVSENPYAGPQGKGWQADIAYTLEARNKVQAVMVGGPLAANDNRPIAVASNAAANDNGLRFLSVCSGIEAASVAWPQWQAVAFSEIEKFPSAVLAHHYPDVPNLGDFTKIDTTTLGRVDILCGGTPCQAFSVAGLRQSLADERGNLSLEFVRLAHELAGNGKTAGNGLRNVVWENVVGVLSTKDNAFGCFLAGLVGADAPIIPSEKPIDGKSTSHWKWNKKLGVHSLGWPGAGLVSGPKGRAAWRVLDAQYFGVAQRRRRVIVVADFGNGADPAAVLFEPEGVQRHSPPSREAGKGVAGGAKGGAGGGGGPTVAANDVVGCMPHQGHGGVDTQSAFSGYIQPIAIGVHGSISHTLKAEGADASEDGTGRGTPIIAFTAKDYGADAQEELAPKLRAGGHSTSHANAGVMPAVTVAIRGRDGGATAELGGDVATALRASQGGGDKPHVLAFSGQMSVPQTDVEMTQTLQDKNPQAVAVSSAVRRLTPRECERLQGFPDDYTLIPAYAKRVPKDVDVEVVNYLLNGNPGMTLEQAHRFASHPDGPRYKALGNSWAVPKFAWLGRRMQALMPANDNAPTAIRAA